MQSGLYVALSSQIALERRLTTISDNMANVNTVGFRGSEVKFDEMVAKNHNDMNARVAFVSQGNDYLSTRQGAFEQTGNSFDFAIKGDAWFSLDTPDGQILTRDGRFTMRPDGALISSSGYPVLDAGGGPIQPQSEWRSYHRRSRRSHPPEREHRRHARHLPGGFFARLPASSQ